MYAITLNFGPYEVFTSKCILCKLQAHFDFDKMVFDYAAKANKPRLIRSFESDWLEINKGGPTKSYL